MRWIANPYREALAGLDRRVYLVVGITLLSVAARMSVYTFLGIYYVEGLGFTLAVVGIAYLAENVLRGLVAPFAGTLSDRFGRRPVIVGSALLTATILPLFLLVKTPAQLFAWSIALGATQAGLWPATSALLIDLVPVARRQTAMSLNYTAISIGYTLGVAPAGFVLILGFGALAAFGAAGYLLIVGLVLIGLRGALPETRPASAGRAGFLRQLSRPLSDGAFVAFGALAFVFPLGIGLIASVAPLYAKAEGLGEGAIGLALATNGPILAVLSIPVATMLVPHGPFRFLALAGALLALSYVALVPDTTFLYLVAASVIFTFGELIFSSAIPTVVAALAPAGETGSYQGAWALVFSVGVGSAVYLSGVIEPRIGWNWTWVAWASLTALASVALLAARKRLRRVADARHA